MIKNIQQLLHDMFIGLTAMSFVISVLAILGGCIYLIFNYPWIGVPLIIIMMARALGRAIREDFSTERNR